MAAVRPSHRRGNNCFIEASKAKRKASARLLVVVDWVVALLGDTPEKPAMESPEQSGLSCELAADGVRELRAPHVQNAYITMAMLRDCAS